MTAANESFPSDLAFEPEPISPFDPQDNTGRRAMVLLGLTFGGLLLVAILVFRLYQPGVRDRADPPFIAAEDTPFRTVPTEDVTETDLGAEVYASLEGNAPDAVVDAPAGVLADDLPEIMEIEVEPVRTAPEPVVAEPTPAPEPIRVADIPSPQPARPEPARPEPVRSEPVRAVTPPPAAGGSSDWVVQVASLRSDAEAQATFATVASRFASDLPGSAYADVARADLAEKGIYYRVRVAGLADKTAANRLCNTFKAQGQACFVTRR